MKQLINAFGLTVSLLGTAHAGTQIVSSVDPSAKESVSMMCRWILDGGKLTDPAQYLTVYENGKNERWLELQPSDEGSMPAIVYKRRSEGGFVDEEKYKEYYWKGADIRLTMIRDTILRKGDITLAIESIDDAKMPIAYAKCDHVAYAGNK